MQSTIKVTIEGLKISKDGKKLTHTWAKAEWTAVRKKIPTRYRLVWRSVATKDGAFFLVNRYKKADVGGWIKLTSLKTRQYLEAMRLFYDHIPRDKK